VTGLIEFEWLRSPQIVCNFEDLDTDHSAFIPAGEIAQLTFPGLSRPVNIHINTSRLIRGIDGMSNRYRSSVIDPLFLGVDTKCRYVVYHLANFYDSHGEGISDEAKFKHWKGRFRLVSDGWTITVDKLKDKEGIFESLKNNGGFAITHVIKVERTSGEYFERKNLSILMEDVFYFLSFARGLWTEPFLAVGFGQDEVEVWRELCRPRTERWMILETWFNYLKPEALTAFWPSFRVRLRHTLWGPVLKRAIRWYLTANQKAGELEGSIVLAQTAHEMLSWTRFVGEMKLSMGV
jgi:hypothetical protein